MKIKMRAFKWIINDYGFVFALRYYYLRKTRKFDEYINLIYEKLSEILNPIINKYKYENGSNCSLEKSNKIWVCWWQGIEYMPSLCRMCFDRLKSVAPESYEVILITKDNYANFVTIPQTIIYKLEAGYISVTQFSDILRQGLLYSNGGLWLDASIWINDFFFSTIAKENEFWSVKLNRIHNEKVLGQKISQCQWAGFLLYGKKGNILSKFAFESMCYYFSNHESTLDYFIQNLTIRIAIDNIDEIKKIVESIEPSNSCLYDLYSVMDSPFDKTQWDMLCSNTGAFKLTQKREYRDEADNKRTFYSYIKELSNTGE